MCNAQKIFMIIILKVVVFKSGVFSACFECVHAHFFGGLIEFLIRRQEGTILFHYIQYFQICRMTNKMNHCEGEKHRIQDCTLLPESLCSVLTKVKRNR